MTQQPQSSLNDLFTITQKEMDWLQIPLWESIFSLSNGLLGTRGSFDELLDGTRSKPMTFMAGLYNTLPEGLPELPVLPNWLVSQITLNGQTFDLRRGHIEHFSRQLNMKQGLLSRRIAWQDGQGHSTELTFQRFLSMHNRHLGVTRIQIKPINWSGPIEVKGVVALPAIQPGINQSHWESARLRATTKNSVSVSMRTRQTRRALGVGAAFDFRVDKQGVPGDGLIDESGVSQRFLARVKQGQICTLDRFVIFMPGEPDAPSPVEAADKTAMAACQSGFEDELKQHADTCEKMWNRIDIDIDGPADDQRAIRYNLFQLATLCPPYDSVASIGPKGLTGTAYLGHIFWDTEIYMLPFFSLTDPRGARTLLNYRVATIDGARKKATETGYAGARYAWESADTGEETCPRYLPDPHGGPPIRVWCGDLQDHITADVPFAIHQYVQATGDNAFLWTCGAEVFFETARFWASRVTLNADGRYDIRDAMGPDEFHIHVNNDAYTNYMAQWNLRAAADLHDSPAFPNDARQAVVDRINLRPDEPETWRAMANQIVTLYDSHTGLINQAENFMNRPEISSDLLETGRRGPITDLTGAGIVIESQVLKQAEVVILQILLGDQFDRQSRAANFDYYAPRTSHDSSLSVSAHAWAASTLDRAEQAYDYFRRAAYLDLEDMAGNSADGLHTANMGGVWLAIVFGFAGLKLGGDSPLVQPRLPKAWKRLRFSIVYRGQAYTITCGEGEPLVQPGH